MPIHKRLLARLSIEMQSNISRLARKSRIICLRASCKGSPRSRVAAFSHSFPSRAQSLAPAAIARRRRPTPFFRMQSTTRLRARTIGGGTAEPSKRQTVFLFARHCRILCALLAARRWWQLMCARPAAKRDPLANECLIT